MRDGSHARKVGPRVGRSRSFLPPSMAPTLDTALLDTFLTAAG
jgi:hypothetical protein